MWLVATLLNNIGLQYFVFPYLLFLVSQRRYVFISLKGSSFKCVFYPIPSSLLWNLPLLKHFSLVFFSFRSPIGLYLPTLNYWVSFILERKSYPLTASSPSSPFLFPSLLHSWRVVCALCFLCITSYSSLNCHALAVVTSACNFQIRWPLFPST